MTSFIPSYELKSFAKEYIGMNIDSYEAKKLGVEEDFEEFGEEMDVEEYIELALEEDDLGELYATMNKADLEKNTAKDKEKEKEEQNKVSGKNGAGI